MITPEEYFRIGKDFYRDGDYTKAIENFSKVIEIEPNFENIYIIRGLVCKDKGDYDMAIADYTQAIRIDSKYSGSYYSRGLAYYYKGNNDKAIADYTQAIKLEHKKTYYNARANAYKALGNISLAENDYNTAKTINN